MINLSEYGLTPDLLPENAAGVPARVLAVHKERYELIAARGACFGRLKSSVYYGGGESFPTTGDFVLIHHNEYGDSQIVQTLARRSKFSRTDLSGHAEAYVKTVLEQVVAANFDYVFIMQSLNQNFNIKRLERYLAMAWQSGGSPAVLLTKADLLDDFTDQLRSAESVAMGAPVHAVSAKTGAGMDALSAYLKPAKTIVFLGSSGVGKSSLVNALAGEEMMTVKTIREDDSRGRHTTTHRQLIMLPSGAMIIDTPGMRELGMWGLSDGLHGAFGDVERYFGLCKFSDCRHQNEPGCALKEAVASGELRADRLDRYFQMMREARFVDDKTGYLRVKRDRSKDISKFAKQLKKGR